MSVVEEIREVLSQALPRDLPRIWARLPHDEPWVPVYLSVKNEWRRKFIFAGPYELADVVQAFPGEHSLGRAA